MERIYNKCIENFSSELENAGSVTFPFYFKKSAAECHHLVVEVHRKHALPLTTSGDWI